jgi:hypothetical protein
VGEALPALAAVDRAFLTDLHKSLSATLAATSLEVRTLHGEVHPGNLLAAADRPRWIDFEAACMGPREWDLTGLPTEALEAFTSVDWSLLGLLRDRDPGRNRLTGSIGAAVVGRYSGEGKIDSVRPVRSSSSRSA